MTDYSKLSNEQISERVAVALGCTVFGSTGEAPIIDPMTGKGFDPCKNWADAGPIIVENKIGMEWCVDQWEVSSEPIKDIHEYFAYDNNPLRAAMIVYLMMKENNNDN